MCLILFAYRLHPQRPLVIAANRDEFYSRPALAADWWHDTAPPIYGGRDLTAHGTWLAVSGSGRLAAVTNWTEDRNATHPQSRGDLPSRFLASGVSAQEFVDSIDGSRYAGFNFIAYDGSQLVYTANRSGEVRVLEPGVYGLTNTRLGAGLGIDGSRRSAGDPRQARQRLGDDEWPKAVLGATALRKVAGDASTEDLIGLLAQSLLPVETPVAGEEAERRHSPCFIRGADYGTRASTAVIVGERSVEFAEQLYGPFGKPGGRAATVFSLDSLDNAQPAQTWRSA